ncbi:hypothetical protein P7C70_g4946, partial [Phenoliferia sp. Uapishka_3]
MSDLPIPGSLYLVDDNHISHQQHAAGKQSIVLSPIPSRDCNDPLNWTFKRKQLAHFSLVVYVMTVGIGGSALYSVITPISEDTGISVSTLNAGTGYRFFGTPIESLIEVSISDLFFAHERGLYIGIYATLVFGSNFVGPLIAGVRSFFRLPCASTDRVFSSSTNHKAGNWSAIISMIGFVWCFLFMEETNYVRSTTEINEEHETGSGTNSSPTEDDLKKSEPVNSSVTPVDSFESLNALQGTPSTILQRLLFFNKRYTSLKTSLTMVYRPLLLLRFPVVFWSGFLYGTSLVMYNILNATASIILSAAPYNFKASSVGLMYVGPIVGVICGSFYSGWYGNKFALWFARRRKGMREAEDRLWLMSLCCLLCPSALILWGVGAAHDLHWIGLAFGFAMSSFCSMVAGSLVLGYCLDSYKDLAGEAMMSVILVRNTLSFAIGYGITPWLKIGLQNTFISAAFVGLAINCTFLPVIKWGKVWRAASRVRYWGYVKNSAATGH